MDFTLLGIFVGLWDSNPPLGALQTKSVDLLNASPVLHWELAFGQLDD